MFSFFNKSVAIYSPVKGNFKKCSDIKDPVFSQGLMGPTFAVEPLDNKIYAPMEGTISTVFPTKHAMGLVHKNGIEMILHVGIDTVELKGAGFNVFVKEGDNVKKGDLLMEVDFDFLKNNGYQTDVIVAITQSKKTMFDSADSVDNMVVVGKCE